MKVGIDTDILDIEREKGGIAYYTKYLVQELSKIKDDIDIYLIHYERNSNPIYKDLNEIIIPLPEIPLRRALRRFLANMTRAEKLLKERDIEVIHLPFRDPFNSPFFFFRSLKKILTVHELGHFLPQRSERNMELKKRIYQKAWIRVQKSYLNIIRNKVDMYIADTKTVKKDLIKYLGIPEDKIKVIYLAPHKIFKQIENAEIPNFIGSPFILSNITPHPEIIFVYHKLKKKGIKHKLVLFGRTSHYAKLKDAISKLNLEKDVIFTGYISTKDLALLYNTADVYVGLEKGMYGFGLPNVEAMACGCPVVTTNVGSLPEVVGDAGILKNPNDISGIANAIYEVLTNDNLREELIKKSLKRAKMFSWEKTAKEIIKVYEDVASGG